MSNIVEISKMLNGFHDESIRFTTPIRVSLPTGVFEIHAACKHAAFGIYLLDRASEWHGPLLASQLNADRIIAALYNRLKLITEEVSDGVAN
jgi:hypothetical protein